MRIACLLILLASPATAWKAEVGPICTLSTQTADASIELIYDPSGPLYSITIERTDSPWVASSVFAMRFDGNRPNTISTNRHRFTRDGAALTVIDRGFGNVLDGLQFNDTATAFTDVQAVEIPLDGAAPEVEKFRSCVAAPTT